MHVYVFDRSKDYIAKYSLLKAIKEVIGRRQAVPVHSRTPAWLVREYINMYKERYESERTSETHTPRLIRRAEIYALLARHLDFISEMILVKRNVALNRDTWSKFKSMVEILFQQGSAEKWEDWDTLENEWGLADKDVPASTTEPAPNRRGYGDDYTDRDYSHTVCADLLSMAFLISLVFSTSISFRRTQAGRYPPKLEMNVIITTQ